MAPGSMGVYEEQTAGIFLSDTSSKSVDKVEMSGVKRVVEVVIRHCPESQLPDWQFASSSSEDSQQQAGF